MGLLPAASMTDTLRCCCCCCCVAAAFELLPLLPSPAVPTPAPAAPGVGCGSCCCGWTCNCRPSSLRGVAQVLTSNTSTRPSSPHTCRDTPGACCDTRHISKAMPHHVHITICLAAHRKGQPPHAVLLAVAHRCAWCMHAAHTSCWHKQRALHPCLHTSSTSSTTRSSTLLTHSGMAACAAAAALAAFLFAAWGSKMKGPEPAVPSPRLRFREVVPLSADRY